jgi:hypothetical protein
MLKSVDSLSSSLTPAVVFFVVVFEISVLFFLLATTISAKILFDLM